MKKSTLILKWLVLAICYYLIFLNLYMTIIYLFFDFTVLGFLITIIYSLIAPLLVPLYIIPIFIILRLQFGFFNKWRKLFRIGKYNIKIKLLWIILGLCGLLLLGSYLPVFTIGGRILEAESQMIQLYGSAYLNLDTTNMRPVPISLWDAALGMDVDESLITVESNIVYLDNGMDKLYFDYYRPSRGTGPFPVIINLHGGAWVLGNKGIISRMPLCKYLASKGFVVFDLQYGVYDILKAAEEVGFPSELLSSPLLVMLQNALDFITPNYQKSYSIEEQVENVGNFTYFLAKYNATYAADLSKVFLIGLSAGAHISSVIATGLKNPLFAGNFSSNITLKGAILYCPVTDMSKLRSAVFSGRVLALPPPFNTIIADGIDVVLNGSLPLTDMYDKLSASFLVKNSSVGDIPPIILFHGDKDNLASYIDNAWSFKQAADTAGVGKCILVTIPGAGHAFDMVFQNYAGQMTLYYLERFLALEVGS